mmetsp:Transcript_162736/g.395341  ORF Transcript_162736/g.395341 Transcript_162736/m.395341 type:complete len:204 (+) Transcript_162736:699-1310(+)
MSTSSSRVTDASVSTSAHWAQRTSGSRISTPPLLYTLTGSGGRAWHKAQSLGAGPPTVVEPPAPTTATPPTGAFTAVDVPASRRNTSSRPLNRIDHSRASAFRFLLPSAAPAEPASDRSNCGIAAAPARGMATVRLPAASPTISEPGIFTLMSLRRAGARFSLVMTESWNPLPNRDRRNVGLPIARRRPSCSTATVSPSSLAS